MTALPTRGAAAGGRSGCDMGLSALRCLAVLGAMSCSAPAQAHHSYAMFDADRSVTIEGAVQELQWTNPHSWLVVHVSNDKGSANWQVELGPPGKLLRSGFKRDAVKPGDKVKVVIHPLRDGRAGGGIVSLVGPDGTAYDDLR